MTIANQDGSRDQGADAAASVDVHCHYVSQELLHADERLVVRTDGGRPELWFDGRTVGGPVSHELTSLSALREDMERAGLARRLLCTASWLTFYWMDAADAQPLVRATNEGLAAAAATDPAALSALASVPLQDPDAALAEVAYAAEELGVAGFAVGTNVAGTYFDDVRFDPFFEAVQDLDLPVFFHPDNVGAAETLSDYQLRWLLGNPQDVTTSMARILLGGVLERYPRLRLCFSLGGGAIPQVIGRLDHGWHVRAEARRKTAAPPSSFLSCCFVDSIVHSDAGLAQAVAVFGPDHVVVGSDWPWDMGSRDPLGAVRRAPGLSAPERQAILGTSAEHLLGPAPAGNTRKG